VVVQLNQVQRRSGAGAAHHHQCLVLDHPGHGAARRQQSAPFQIVVGTLVLTAIALSIFGERLSDKVLGRE